MGRMTQAEIVAWLRHQSDAAELNRCLKFRAAADLIERQAQQIAAVRQALGFVPAEERDGVIVTHDAYYNLMGPLYELRAGRTADAVTVRTIDRVVGQLAEARRALSEEEESRG